MVSEGMVETYMEPPFDEEHTCEESHMQVYGLQFFAEILKECKTNTDVPHPTLHSKMTTKFRNQLNNPQGQALFDAMVVKEYSFNKIKSTMHRRYNRGIILNYKLLFNYYIFLRWSGLRLNVMILLLLTRLIYLRMFLDIPQALLEGMKTFGFLELCFS